MFCVMAGACTLKRVAGAGIGIGVEEVAPPKREFFGQCVLDAGGHGEHAAPTEPPAGDALAKKLGVGVVDVAKIDVDQGLFDSLVGDAPRVDGGERSLQADRLCRLSPRGGVVFPSLLPDRAFVRKPHVPVVVYLVE